MRLSFPKATAGDPTLDQSFELDDRKWGVLMFWFYGEDHYEPTPAHFSWSISDTQPLFD